MENFESTGMESGSTEATQDVSQSTGTPGASPDQGKDAVTSDLVEVALGSVKGKIPKDMADAIKNFERGVQKKFQESAQERKRYQEMESGLKNPAQLRKILSDAGVDPYEFAEMTLAEKIEALEMTPEQKKLKEYEEELSRYKENEQKAREEMERQEFTAREQAGMKSLDQEIGEAFRDSGLPKDPFFVQKIAAEMLGAAKRGESLTAKDAASKIKSWFSKSVRQAFEGLGENPELLRELIGDQTLKKLRDHDLKRVTGQASQQAAKKSPGDPASRQKQDKPMTEKEYRKWIESLKG